MAEGRTNAGGGGFNKSVIIVTAPTGSTVTCTKGTTVKTATEKNGEWRFKNLDIGTWTLKATLSGQTATQTVNITQFDVYRVTMSYFKSTIKVTYPAGSTCTCSKGDKTLTAPDTSGRYDFVVDSAGEWTVSCTDGENKVSKVVSITKNGQSVEVALAYALIVYDSGNTYDDVTGGWFSKTYGDTGRVSFSSSAIEFSYSTQLNAWSTAGINNNLDLTPYETLNFDMEASGEYEYDGGKFTVGVTPQKTTIIKDSRPSFSAYSEPGSISRKVISVDINKISKGYVSIYGIAKAKIYKIWMDV